MQITPQNISKACNISFGKFDHFRRARGRFLSQMAGRFYSRTTPGDREDRKAAPLNLLYTAVTTLVPNLVYNNPKVRVATDILPYRDYADRLQMATNSLIKKTNFRMMLRKTITDAIFMAGFVKTGLASGDEFLSIDDEDANQNMAVGQPYADRIDPDDMILDPMARDWDEQAFVGHKFRVAEDDLVASGLFDEDALKNLPGHYDGANGSQRDEAEGLIGDKSGQEFQEVEKYIDLMEVYLPKEGIIVTLPYMKDKVQDTFLRTVEYSGPTRGPYHMLGFTSMSNNILPVAPAGIWYDLHILGNRIARKLSRQAERIKRVVAYEGTAVEDVEQIADADDGETVRVDNLDKIREIQYGGAGNDSFNWVEWVKKNFSEQSGNIDLLNGTNTNSPTATQAEMLQANTSVRLADMQNSVYEFAAEVQGDLVYHLHTDPLITLPLTKQQNGTAVQEIFTGGEQQGDWLDYNISVQPYSMARPDPNAQVRRKMEFATNVIPAAAQAVNLLGPGFLIGPFLRRMAMEVGIDDADEFLNDDAFQEWIMERLAMQTGDPGKAAGDIQMPQLAALPGTVTPNPGQPNPRQMGPTGGTSPQQMQNQQQQEAAGRLQGGRTAQPSASALAATMST